MEEHHDFGYGLCKEFWGRIQNVSTELYKRAGLDIPKILGGTS